MWHSSVSLVRCIRPWSSTGLWDVETPTLSRQSTHRWRWVCQPYAPAALCSSLFLLHFSVKGWFDSRNTVRLEGLCLLKTTVTSPGIKPATFRLVLCWVLGSEEIFSGPDLVSALCTLHFHTARSFCLPFGSSPSTFSLLLATNNQHSLQ
jgi:hypothetical protein